ncbi:MAG: ATP-dependent DNA ligase [Candidatus Micrarchaeota archaeon]|nr:ATP-dependent DNA ligase [Candidatus Micrarchaeota archaeon]
MLFEEVAGYYSKLEETSSRLSMIDILTDIFSKAKKGEIKSIIYMTVGSPAPPFQGVDLGIAEKLAEEAIATATGAEKQKVEASFRKTGDLGLTAEQFISGGKLRRMSREKFEINEVFETMLKIARTGGVGSKDAKIKMLANLLAASTPLEARYIVRFALGQLRLGAGDATILEALSKAATGDRELKPKLEEAFNICSDLGLVGETLMKEGKKGIEDFRVTLFNPIRPALAERLPTAEEILERMRGECAVESKYDGLRVQVHMDRKSKKVEIFSRRLERMTEMFPDIVGAALKEINADKVILEGEAIAYDEATDQFHAFQETIQRKRKHGIEEKSEELPLRVFSFDLLYLEGESYLSRKYRERRAKLEKIVKGNGMFRLSGRILATKPKEIEKYFEEMISDGLEGIVAKDLDAPYIAGARKFSWIKMKRSYKGELSDTVDLVVVGYYAGKGIRTEFGFGGMLAAVYNEKSDMFETITRIGTGFSEENMRTFKKLFEKIKTPRKPARVESLVEPDYWVEPKYVVTVRADEITKSPMHTAGRHKEGEEETGYALRFPRIVSNGIREDKSPEEATTTKEILEMFKQQRKTKVGEEA